MNQDLHNFDDCLGYNRSELAQLGESAAARHLQESGYTIIERNWRDGRSGELDIIATDPGDSIVVFVEVKSRLLLAPVVGFDWPGFDALDRRKQRRLIRLAKMYLTKNLHAAEIPCRFDVAVVYFESKYKQPLSEQQPQVYHVPDAFYL